MSLNFIEFHWISLDSIGFQWISLDFNGFHRISSDFNGFYKPISAVSKVRVCFLSFRLRVCLSWNEKCHQKTCKYWRGASVLKCSPTSMVERRPSQKWESGPHWFNSRALQFFSSGKDPIHFHWISLDFNGFHWISLDFIWFHWLCSPVAQT